MTQVGEGPRAAETAATEPNDTALDGLSVGDILAERYRLEQHINNDSAGRQVWRGVDVVLRRPVAVVLRHPGGSSAQEMLSAAVTASRVVHPNLIGVYDAIDENTRAYVVREWIDGTALRDLVAEEPFDAERTTSTLHLVAEAVAALHASGMAHGNIHPGTVLVGDGGRVVLADARVDTDTSTEADVKSLGALGYFMLTGHWPRAKGGRSVLPDARRDSTGAFVAPSKIRAGVPSYLDDLVMDLLSPDLALPTAHVLAVELGRLDTAEQLLFGGAGTLRFSDDTGEPAIARSATTRLMVAGGIAVALIAAGVVFGIKALSSAGADTTDPSTQNGTPPGASAAPSSEPAPVAQKLPLNAAQVRIVDPDGKRDEFDGAELMVDGKVDTAWLTDGYRDRSNFGNIKSGMGVLIKLDKPELISSVRVQLTAAGATAELRTGSQDFGNSTAGDRKIHRDYVTIGERLEKHQGTTMVFSTDLETAHQYLMIWFTDLPLGDDGKYRIGVQEITVEVQ